MPIEESPSREESAQEGGKEPSPHLHATHQNVKSADAQLASDTPAFAQGRYLRQAFQRYSLCLRYRPRIQQSVRLVRGVLSSPAYGTLLLHPESPPPFPMAPESEDRKQPDARARVEAQNCIRSAITFIKNGEGESAREKLERAARLLDGSERADQ